MSLVRYAPGVKVTLCDLPEVIEQAKTVRHLSLDILFSCTDDTSSYGKETTKTWYRRNESTSYLSTSSRDHHLQAKRSTM